jgi:mannose-1-phosphate guanylyltransferase/phosphomannomutase
MRSLTELTSKEERKLADGIKVYYGKDWVFLLPSTNRSLFHVFSEAGSIKEAKELARRFVKEIKRLVREVYRSES